MSPDGGSEKLVPTFDILVEGSPLAQEQKDRLKEIVIVDYLHLPGVCTVNVTYPKAEGVDSMPYSIGSKIEVRMGGLDELAPKTLFKGEVVTIEPEFGAGGCAVSVRAYHRSHRLHRSRQVRSFQNMTASDIVSKIAGENGMSADVESSGHSYEFMQQDNETDWDFMWRLAERVGFECVVDDQKLIFRRPQAEGAVALMWPDTLRSFSPRLTGVQQVDTVTLSAFNPKTKDVISASAGSPHQIAEIGIKRGEVVSPFGGGKVHVATEPVKNTGEGNALAQALLDKLANGYIAADGVAPGNPDIKAGAKITVTGIGSKFSGSYRVATCTHVLRAGGYETHFANSPSHTISGTVGANAGPSVGAHLVVGIVTNNNDPDQMGRLRVKYPALSDELEGTWAPVVTASAGNGRGLLMLPVVGEEVLVGFEHEDTTRPYVLGSLFNGKDKPGTDLLQAQDGSFSLLSNKKIFLKSKEDYLLTVGGKATVEVAGNVEEKYKADWKNDTTGGATLKSTQAFSIEGQSVSIKGQTQVTIEAQATLTLKCGAAKVELSAAGVTISGPLINIG